MAQQQPTPRQTTPRSPKKWWQNKKFFWGGVTLLGLIVGILGVVISPLGPEIRLLVGLDRLQPDIITCMESVWYEPDPHPGDHHIPDPVYLKTKFKLRNIGTMTSLATFVNIHIHGMAGSAGSPVTSDVDWTPTKPVTVPDHGATAVIQVSTVVSKTDQMSRFLSAQSQVTWAGGSQGKTIVHTKNDTEWTNDPICATA